MWAISNITLSLILRTPVTASKLLTVVLSNQIKPQPPRMMSDSLINNMELLHFSAARILSSTLFILFEYLYHANGCPLYFRLWAIDRWQMSGWWVGGKSEEAGRFHLATLTPNAPVDETGPCLFGQQEEPLISLPWQPKSKTTCVVP